MIYADNAATTQISDLAFTKMLPFLREEYGNASTQYSLGIKAKRAIEFARKQVADAIGSDPSEIIFTSGGSEGNSWVLQGISILFEGEPIHIVTSSIEHYSVIKSCSALEKRGISVTYLPVNSNGFVSVSDIKSSLRSNTKLVSIMLANNEIGTIQPISEIGKLLRDLGILFHTDAVQAIGHMPINVRDLEVDFMTASAHKFNGAKGTGFLYSRSGLALPPIIFGGNQEQGKRSGTENVAGFVALGYAIEENVAGIEQSSSFVRKLIEITLEDIIKQIPDVYTNGDTFEKLPGIINLGFNGISGEALMNLLDLKGICVSTSSACTSGENTPSHVLMALGLSETQAKSAIRISYSKYNTESEAKEVAAAICSGVKAIRRSK